VCDDDSSHGDTEHARAHTLCEVVLTLFDEVVALVAPGHKVFTVFQFFLDDFLFFFVKNAEKRFKNTGNPQKNSQKVYFL
jgi:hypothetical protein